MKNHILTFHERKTFDCDLCSYKGTYKQNLKSHIKAKHEGALFECDHCDYTGPLLTRYYHIKKHQVDGNWIKLDGKWEKKKNQDEYPTHFCDQCDYLAMTKNQLKLHIKSKHEGKRIKCPKCDKTYVFHSDMVVHFKAEHDQVKFKCQKCEFESKWKGTLDAHEGGGFKCNHCSYIGSEKSNLVAHQKRLHRTTKLNCREDDCVASFSSKSFLNEHKRQVHNVKKLNSSSPDKYPCHLCDFEDATREGLLNHISETHQSIIKIKNEVE